MLITKFNKLIRNKILWAILAITIAFFFVGASVMSRSGCGRVDGESAAAGILFGDEVSGQDFYIARFYEMGMRPMADNSEEAVAALRERTWQRLAALRMAERMGITVTDDDIRGVITQDPTFTSNGAFDQQRYLAFLQNQLRIDPGTFEDYLRQDLTLRRLMAALRTATWTTPYEISSRLSPLTDHVSIEYATMKSEPDTNEVSVSEADLASFFEEHRDAFRIDEQRRVRYVAFPISNQLATVKVTDSDIDQYYNNHIDQYTTVDTNNTETVQPLAEVRDSITTTLRDRKARFEAKDTATRFVMALAPDRYGQAYEMEQAVQDLNLRLMTSGWFTASQPIAALAGAGLAASQAAFELLPKDPERYFSDAIAGSNAVYVIAYEDSRPAHDPDLDEVREQVVSAAALEAAEVALTAEVESTRDQLAAAAADTNRSFMATAEDMGLMTATTGVFTVYEGLPETVPYSTELITELIDADEGDVFAATDAPEGILIAHVAHRHPGEPGAADLLRPQFTSTMDQYTAAALYRDWIDQVMDESGFEDYHPITNE